MNFTKCIIGAPENKLMLQFAERLAMLKEHVEVSPFYSIALLDEQQFTNSDVEAAAYVASTQLHNWVSRGWIRLSGANPGRGKRRLYSGSDVIAVAVAAALQPFGMMQVAEQLVRVNQIYGRAQRLFTDPSCRIGYALAIVPSPENDDYLYVPLGPEVSDPDLPTPSCVVLEVDRLIVETLENLVRILNNEPVPDRSFPERKSKQQSEDEFLTFTGAAYRDDGGNRIYRGLSLEESQEYEKLMDHRLSESGPMSDDDWNKYQSFRRRNEMARMEHIGANLDEDAETE